MEVADSRREECPGWWGWICRLSPSCLALGGKGGVFLVHVSNAKPREKEVGD